MKIRALLFIGFFVFSHSSSMNIFNIFKNIIDKSRLKKLDKADIKNSLVLGSLIIGYRKYLKFANEKKNELESKHS